MRERLSDEASTIAAPSGAFFKQKPLARMATFGVERYKKSRLETDAAPGTVNRELAALSHLFTKTVEWKWLDHRPAKINQLNEDKGRIVYLTTEQMAAAKQDQNPHVYPFTLIGLETSMRRMEILSIRLQGVDLGRRIIFIPRAKGGAREQPITQQLAVFLRGYLGAAEEGQEWLFPAPQSRRVHVVAIEKAYRRVVVSAGFNATEVVRHKLRHTAITHLVQAGVDG